ncbi:alpha-D-ribose 1-methylphosphonate 5-triphosphate diphosphatase [Mucilaginibacter sp. cycad4]|uniref:alpha-D-ribose 1-methylphosphonate 5-triphosphate diphosphatase n=1 Tax=Mucilaginibacter sp. cycad4 TaxID=3342096 RepID=UPI002AAB5DBB|nr:alpha-D-ribose 1-methylphosphonate 5-triphosphate diphosphatase [Mucilaginibacter gossypii]WPV00775.1 alpha-D-ribose 1-methylphosphonate 5-triphosphate diphosphatase [Mucilaginibacter gossypii]
MNTHLLSNARIVTPTEDFTGSVMIENGIISEIIKDKYYPEGIDLKGRWLIPGCIDIHTDYLEKELYPRSGAGFPLPFALHFMDTRAAACGITTVFSAVSFSDNEEKNRSLGEAMELSRQIDVARHSLLVRHFLHARIDPNSEGLPDYLEPMRQLESLYMVVYNDHIPGQRQYTLQQQIELRTKAFGITPDEAMARLQKQMDKTSKINNRAQIYETFKDKYILGSHDDTTIEHVEEGKYYGATLSEMPTTLAAARKAKELGLWICLGAPNYYRGGSHCGNLSSIDAMAEDLCDILCSDYHFPTMLGSVVKMMGNGINPSKAVNMVSLNPARLLNFDAETGSIEVGKKADLVAFSSEKSFASVSHVFVDGITKYRADYSVAIQPLAVEQTELNRLNTSV